MDQSFESNK